VIGVYKFYETWSTGAFRKEESKERVVYCICSAMGK
jgi:hypothetical protein